MAPYDFYGYVTSDAGTWNGTPAYDNSTAGNSMWPCFQNVTSAATSQTITIPFYAGYAGGYRIYVQPGQPIYYYPSPCQANSCIYPELPPETPEQKAAREERERQLQAEFQERMRQWEAERQRERERQEELDKKREAGKKRAEELLKSYIGVEAFGELYKAGHLELDSRKYAGRKYRVPARARDLIEIVEDSKVVDRLCVHPAEIYADGDEILTRIVMLKFDEDYIVGKANHNRVRVPA